jgi:dTDP-4-dehydrorhamnose reductase
MAQQQPETSQSRLGVVIGGSGLVGGTIVNYFKTKVDAPVDVRAPNSKKLSLREPTDIINYIIDLKPDFIINAAIANINADEQLSFQINYLGPYHLAKAAIELGIPYIHISSAATLKLGTNITEKDQRAFTPGLSNYTRSKLMTEKTLSYLHKNEGLDYTVIRLAAVYGNHDHKIQGFHRMMYAVADESMPVMFTKKGVLHSYTNCRKLPYFIDHVLKHRDEFSGGDYNFVDPNPVELKQLILSIKAFLEVKYPKEICVPYALARLGQRSTTLLLRVLRKFGLKADLPPELIFLKQFYITQTLSCERLQRSSFIDPMPNDTIFTRLPEMIFYYLTRWSHQNLISTFKEKTKEDNRFYDTFIHQPESLIEATHTGKLNTSNYLIQVNKLNESAAGQNSIKECVPPAAERAADDFGKRQPAG